MKKFSFAEIDKKLNKKARSSVQEKQQSDNFLKLYEDIPPDPKMQAYCQSAAQQFHEKLNNHRHYSYHLEKQPTTDQQRQRLSSVKKLMNFHIGFKPEIKEQPPISETQRKESELKQQLRKRRVREKFRKNVKIVIQKLNKLKMKPDDVIKLGIFSKEPYKFGKEIFDAIKNNGNQEKVWRILMENKLAIFSVDNTQKSPLIWSCIRGYPAITKMLLDVGSDPNKEDQGGFNALYYSIKYNNAECVKVLMLRLAWIEEKHSFQSISADEKVRNMFRLGMNLSKAMKNIEPNKREELFNEQYKYFYS